MSKRSARNMPGGRQARAQARPGGAGGVGGGQQPNVQQMMAQVQRMQQEMAEAQDQLKHETVSASAGGGMVTVRATGDLKIAAVEIDPEAVDPEDVEILADMVLAATNEALRAAQDLAASRMDGATGGVDLGALGDLGGLGLPGLES
jgi:nucleoid-associated protein EbfC